MAIESSLTIAEFCAAEKISRGLYYKLKKQGRGPREMELGPGAKRISFEAHQEWRRAREAEDRRQTQTTQAAPISATP
jgi:hypothetical protein